MMKRHHTQNDGTGLEACADCGHRRYRHTDVVMKDGRGHLVDGPCWADRGGRGKNRCQCKMFRSRHEEGAR